MTQCTSCNGTGVIERTVGGNGVCESDVETVCRDCDGLGFPEAAEMLATIIAVRDSDRMARALGQPGLGTALRARIARTIAATADYSTERLGEIRAKEMMR